MPCLPIPTWLLPRPLCVNWVWPNPFSWFPNVPALPTVSWPSVDWPVVESDLLLIFFISVGGFLLLYLLRPVRAWADEKMRHGFDKFRRKIEHEEDERDIER
jgi:hypothetical protein